MRASDFTATRDLRDRAAHLATVASMHLREIAILAAPLDSTSFGRMETGAASISDAIDLLEVANATIADLGEALARAALALGSEATVALSEPTTHPA